MLMGSKEGFRFLAVRITKGSFTWNLKLVRGMENVVRVQIDRDVRKG